MASRREILKLFGIVASLPFLKPLMVNAAKTVKPDVNAPNSTIVRAVNGKPGENIAKACELLGGIETLIGPSDVVVIKPNVQWWNQGAPNIAALYSFVKLVMAIPGGFSGEIVLAENCHRGADPSNATASGWLPKFERNATIARMQNYNDLAQQLKNEFGERFSTIHWINVSAGARRVYHPDDSPGYAYCDGTGGLPKLIFSNGLEGENKRETIMSYPVFKTDQGTLVDLKNGIYENGRYDSKRLKFINFAALNHHSTYCGFTSLIKNYLGVSDLSGGPNPHNGGKLIDDYYNFHAFPFNNWAPGPQPGMLGAEIGVYLSTIRKADLNIVTAEWIGLASRTEPPVVRTRTVLACTDPVALDYHSAKYLLYPNSRIPFHNPDDPDSPTYQYLKACADHGGGEFDERKVAMVSYDHKAGRLQRNDEAVIIGEKEWGSHTKTIAKYLLMRYGSWLL